MYEEVYMLEECIYILAVNPNSCLRGKKLKMWMKMSYSRNSSGNKTLESH